LRIALVDNHSVNYPGFGAVGRHHGPEASPPQPENFGEGPVDQIGTRDVRAIVRAHRPQWPGSSFLSQLDPALLEEFLDTGTLVVFGHNDVLMSEGDKGTDVYLLLSSYVKVTARVDGRRTALLAIRVGGDLVGEVAASGAEHRIATVTACAREPVCAVRLDGEDFARLASRYPASLLLLSQAVGRKLGSATRRRVDYSGRPPLIRLARVLVELADDHGRALGPNSVLIAVDLTQLELGSLIGVRESSMLRALRQLKERGLVDSSGRRPVIRNVEILRAIAYPDGESAK
jgi:CRP-like cAMP-binding protein